MSATDFVSDVFAVARSEFRQFTRSRTAMLISLLILPGFFIFSLGASGGAPGAGASTTARVRVAFIDNDNSLASMQLLDVLSRSEDLDLAESYNEASAISTLGKGGIYAVVIVPEGFEEEFLEHRSPSLVLYMDDSEPGLSDDVQSSLRNHLQVFSPTQSPQVRIISKGRALSSFDVGLVIVLGVVQIFATFYEIAGGMSRTREEGSYARLLLTRTSLWAVLLGKTVYDSALGIIRTFLVVGAAIYAYGAHPSTGIATILILSLLMALVTMGFAFFVSAFGISTRTVVIFEFLLVMFIFGFSGMTIDRELLFGIPRAISTVLPWTYGFHALRRTILTGEPLMNVSFDLQWIGAAIAVLYVSAYALFAVGRERMIG